MKSIFEEMGDKYRQMGDYFIPDITLLDDGEYQKEPFLRLWFDQLSYPHILSPALRAIRLFPTYLCLWAFCLGFLLQREVLAVR